MSRRRAVLFDAAGTLIALREPVGETYARIARAFGVALPAERIDDAFRRVHAAAAPMAFPGAPPADVPDLEREWWRRIVRATFRAADGTASFADFDGYFARLFEAMAEPGCWRAVPGAADLLDALRARGFATGIVSNFDFRLRAILQGLGLAARLDAVVLPSDVGAAKPDPAGFLRALELLGADAAASWFVGDDPAQDLAAARAVGLRAIDVASSATLDGLLNRIED